MNPHPTLFTLLFHRKRREARGTLASVQRSPAATPGRRRWRKQCAAISISNSLLETMTQWLSAFARQDSLYESDWPYTQQNWFLETGWEEFEKRIYGEGIKKKKCQVAACRQEPDVARSLQVNWLRDARANTEMDGLLSRSLARRSHCHVRQVALVTGLVTQPPLSGVRFASFGEASALRKRRWSRYGTGKPSVTETEAITIRAWRRHVDCYAKFAWLLSLVCSRACVRAFVRLWV